jgi:histidinol-phosphate aminotransferase
LIQANRYPDHYANDLAREISARTGVAPERITFGNGSGELLVQSALISLEPSDEAVMPSTGGILGEDDLRHAIAEVPETCLLVIDEAYHEFAGIEGGPSVLPLLAARRGPWVVSRTFSKAYCLAGLRVGYVLTSSAELNLGFVRLRNNFNVSRPSLAAALAALRDDDYVAGVIEKTIVERRYLAEGLSRLGATSLPSFANFLTVRLPVEAAPVVDALAAKGIEVQLVRWPDALGAIRITIGTRADSDRLLAAMV